MGEKNNITKFIYQEIVTIKAKTKAKKRNNKKLHVNSIWIKEILYTTPIFCVFWKNPEIENNLLPSKWKADIYS